MLISDSIYQSMSESDFFIYPMEIEKVSDEEIRVANFFNVTLIDSNTAVLADSVIVTTLHRLTEKVRTFSDYDCALGISRKEFGEVLHHEFRVRAILRNCPSPPSLPERIKEPPPVPFELDLSFDDDSKFPARVKTIHTFEFTEGPYPCDTETALSPTNLIYNADSSRVLVEFQRPANCNDHFSVDPILFETGKLVVRLLNTPSHCPQSCLFSFYLMLEHEGPLFVDDVEIRE